MFGFIKPIAKRTCEPQGLNPLPLHCHPATLPLYYILLLVINEVLITKRSE
jgi:hypothetical protein